jgi:hypothetical protein
MNVGLEMGGFVANNTGQIIATASIGLISLNRGVADLCRWKGFDCVNNLLTTDRMFVLLILILLHTIAGVPLGQGVIGLRNSTFPFGFLRKRF